MQQIKTGHEAVRPESYGALVITTHIVLSLSLLTSGMNGAMGWSSTLSASIASSSTAMATFPVTCMFNQNSEGTAVIKFLAGVPHAECCFTSC